MICMNKAERSDNELRDAVANARINVPDKHIKLMVINGGAVLSGFPAVPPERHAGPAEGAARRRGRSAEN